MAIDYYIIVENTNYIKNKKGKNNVEEIKNILEMKQINNGNNSEYKSVMKKDKDRYDDSLTKRYNNGFKFNRSDRNSNRSDYREGYNGYSSNNRGYPPIKREDNNISSKNSNYSTSQRKWPLNKKFDKN